jgi:hypothetical protein
MREQQHSSSQLLFIYFESLPHLLPRQAFSFGSVSRKSGCRIVSVRTEKPRP